MVVPYSKANGPPAFSEMLPPSEEPALEAGSTVKSSPFLAAAWMAFRVITPDCAVMVRSAGSMSRIFLKRDSDRITQRASAGMAPPVAPVPPPRGMTPKCSSLASRTMPWIWASSSGKSTSMGSSMRRSVASVADSMRECGSLPMASSGMNFFSRETMPSRKARTRSRGAPRTVRCPWSGWWRTRGPAWAGTCSAAVPPRS